MRFTFFVLLFAATGLAQDGSPAARADTSCGIASTEFDVKVENSQTAPQPAANKAIVYIVQDAGHGITRFLVSQISIDGTKVGAVRGNSYAFFELSPGEHHLCVTPQGKTGSRDETTLANFTAEAGKSYYFLRRHYSTRDDYFIEMTPLNTDEGRFMVAESRYSASHPKAGVSQAGK